MEKQKEVVSQEQADSLLCILSKCYITGCEVHTLFPDFVHYTAGANPSFKPVSSMDERLRKGYELYKKNMNCTLIEVYQRHFCVVGNDGSTQVIEG